jgi:hypothetical protein
MDEIKPNNLASLLRDFAQGASNSVASNVSVPVDAIAWLLRKGGVNVPPNPVMGSDWMAEKGLTREPQNKLAGFAGDMAGMVTPFAAAAKAPQIARGLLAAGEAMPEFAASAGRHANYLPKKIDQTGAIVWHGSPHKFDAFDASKIGTGEGAQAYGHGLYLAENPTTAKWYKDALSTDVPPVATTNGDYLALEALKKSGGDKQKAIQFLQDGTIENTKLPSFAAERSVDKFTRPVTTDSASLYKVDLPDEHIAKMLDWDKPLSQQSPHVQQAISKTKSMLPQNAIDDLGGDLSLMYGKDVTPEQFLNTWESFGQKAGGENTLKSLGVPGIKYLDGGSRGAGQGSSNYVVFPGNERLLKILERNGQSLP